MTDTERPSLLELREKLSHFQRGLKAVNSNSDSSGFTAMHVEQEFLECQKIPGGVPRGVICEITGTARTEWMISLLCENPKLITFWIEDRLSILPTAMHQRGVDLSRILIAEAGDKLFQALRKALRSQLFDCVVLPGIVEDMKMLKALQLFARESNAAVFFLSQVAKNAWAIPFQISVNWEQAKWVNPGDEGRSLPLLDAPQGGKDYSVQILKSKFSRSQEGNETEGMIK